MSSDEESDSAPSGREYFVLFLECYKECRCLWDTASPDYSNRDLKKQCYERLLKVYKKVNKNASLSEMKKKIDNLRTTYKRETKKVKESMKTGSGAQDIYCPRLWYYDYLTFLDEKELSHRSGEDSLDDRDAGSSGNVTQNGTQNDEFTVPPSKIKRKKQDTLFAKQTQILDQAQKILASDEDKDWEVIGKSIGLQLKTLTEEQSAIAQKIIADALFYAKMKKLTIHSGIFLEPPHSPLPSPSFQSHHSSSRNYNLTPSPSPSPQGRYPSPVARSYIPLSQTSAVTHNLTMTQSPSPAPQARYPSLVLQSYISSSQNSAYDSTNCNATEAIIDEPSPVARSYIPLSQTSAVTHNLTMTQSPSPAPQARYPSPVLQTYISSSQNSAYATTNCNATEAIIDEPSPVARSYIPSPQTSAVTHNLTMTQSPSPVPQARYSSPVLQSYISSSQNSAYATTNCNATEAIIDEECAYSSQPPVPIQSPASSSTTSNYLEGALKEFFIFKKKDNK